MKGFEKCCIATVVEGNGGDMLWNVRSECDEEKRALNVKMETVTLIGKGTNR